VFKILKYLNKQWKTTQRISFVTLDTLCFIVSTLRLFRIAVTDSKPRFQVPIDIPSEGDLSADPLYDVTFTTTPSFGIRVIRRTSGHLILGERGYVKNHASMKFYRRSDAHLLSKY